MGGQISQVYWGGDPNAVDPVSGLTRREVMAVQRSWIPVYAKQVSVGSELLKRFFREFPEAKKYFRMLNDVPEEEYDNNIQFRAHVITLMNSLNLAVNSLSQPEVCAALMQKLGESHGRRNIKERYFYDLKGVIVRLFIEVLRLDTYTLNAWDKTIDFWYRNVFLTLSSASAGKHNQAAKILHQELEALKYGFLDERL